MASTYYWKGSLDSILEQLKQRQIFKVATIYAVSAWPLIQIADLAVPALGLPDSVMTLLLKIFIIGFPISLVFAWLYNFTAKGIVRIKANDGYNEHGNPAINIKTTIAVAGSLVMAVVITLLTQWILEPQNSQSANQPQLSIDNKGASQVGKKLKKSIAILPFVPFSADPEDAFFADGMVEELLNLMAKIPNLKVAARTSSFAYKGNTTKTITEIGKELGVDIILEGSIRKNDVSNKIRVTAQLIEVSTGKHLWSETYDRQYRDIFQIQDNIAQSVVEKMKITVLGKPRKQQFIVGTQSVDAMVEYGKGQAELSHRTIPSLEKALTHFNAAVKYDENYARAFVGIADANILLALYGNLPENKANAAAQAAIDKALTIDNELAAAYASQGLLYTKTNQDKAIALFKQAIDINPSYAMTYMWYGTLLQSQGDIGGAHQLFEKAYELDPKSPVAAYNVAWCYYLIGAEDKAMQLFSLIIGNDPYYPGAYNLAGDILKNRGRLDESISMYLRALTVDPLNKAALNGLIIANMDMFNFSATEQWFMFANNHSQVFSANEVTLLNARYSAVQGKKDQALNYLKLMRVNAETITAKAALIEGAIAFYQQEYSKTVNILVKFKASTNTNAFYHLADGQLAIQLSYAYQQLKQFDQGDAILKDFENYLQNSVSKTANNSSYYYNMMAIKILKNEESQALNYFQGAIDTGWVETWKTNFEPIFTDIKTAERFNQMLGGVITKLNTMKVNSQRQANFLTVDSDSDNESD